MAYQLKSKTGQPIKKDGMPVMGSDQIGVKIEQLDDANLTFLAVASTEDEDRDKDIIRQSGWDLKNFKKNPIIPWSHNYWELPVAKSIRTWVDSVSKRLLFKPKFDKNDEFSLKIFQKYATGFLTSFSVGFRGIDFKFRDENNQWFGGREFIKQELLEVSTVAVPANPNANINLSFENVGIVKSMLDIGYPDYFARRNDEWLFYPIRDPGQFSTPKQIPIENISGAFSIQAKAIDKDHPEGDAEVVVGYSFDPTQFDKDLAIDFVKEYGEKTVKSFYYQVQYDDEKGISVEPKIEDIQISTYSTDIKDFNWGDPNSVPTYYYRIMTDDKTKCVEEEPPSVPELGVPEEEVEKGQDSQPSEVSKGNEQEVTIEVKTGIENILENILKGIGEIGDAVKKLIDKQEKVCDNKTDPVDDPDELEITETCQDQKSDGDGELDIIDTEVNPPDSNTVDNKSDSDGTIEIDEAEMNLVGEIGKGLIVEKLKNNLKEQLTEIVVNSGKID